MPSLTDRLNEALERSGKSRRTVARQTPIDLAHLSRVLRGDVGLGFEKGVALSETLGVSPRWLLGLDDRKPARPIDYKHPVVGRISEEEANLIGLYRYVRKRRRKALVAAVELMGIAADSMSVARLLVQLADIVKAGTSLDVERSGPSLDADPDLEMPARERLETVLETLRAGRRT